MRIRTIKPEFFTHEGLFEAEKATKLPLRVAFAGLWCVADKAGRFKWEPRRIGVSVLPYDGIDFSRVLDALLTRGFLVKYASGGAEYGAIPSFLKHQFLNNREKESIIPEPPSMLDCDATATRDARVDDASEVEGKGKEGKEEHARARDAHTDEAFMSELKANPAYQGIDIDREIRKMQAWLLTPKGRGRKLSRQFIVNWLNKAERPLLLPVNGSNGGMFTR